MSGLLGKEVENRIAQRRADLARLERANGEEARASWPPDMSDWAMLGIFAQKHRLTSKIYDELAAVQSWYIQYLLCGNEYFPDRLLYQFAGLDPQKPLPLSADGLYDLERGADELRAKQDPVDIRKFAWTELRRRKRL